MDKESNIHSHYTAEQQNSPNMCKEHVLAEFDAIKATIDIIDKRKGEVSTFWFIGFNDMLDLGCKDHQLNDNILIGLVKPIDMMCGEVNKSNDKLDEALDVGVIVYCAMLQSSPPPNAMDYQNPQPTDKGSVGFNDMMDPRCKDQPFNDNVRKVLVKLYDTMSGEDNISDYKLDVTVAGGVIVDHRVQSPKNPSLIDNVEDPRPFARTRKRNHTGYVKDHNTIVHCHEIHEILVVPWVEDLSRPPNSHNRKVTLPVYFDNIYHLPAKTTHIFLGNKTSHSVDRDFWLTLLDCSDRGWLSDKQLDDQWATAGPYFYALVMLGEVPFWPANGVKYLVPWTEVDRNLPVSTDHDPTHVGLAY
nr:hypothetical protein [Tanacetum cinerariifolium]